VELGSSVVVSFAFLVHIEGLVTSNIEDDMTCMVEEQGQGGAYSNADVVGKGEVYKRDIDGRQKRKEKKRKE
jgi:hypothetical protein